MAKAPIVTSVEVNEIEFEIKDVTTEPIIGIPIYEKGSSIQRKAHVLRINTDAGITGEYFGGNAVEYAAIPGLARLLIGKNALDRELFYNDAKQALRQEASMGRSQIDIALWDIAGKLLDVPVHQLLGTYRKEFPCYASTYISDFDPEGLSSAEAMADFAEQCFELGYPAFKIHPWMGQPLNKQIEMVAAVGKRMAGKMDLMLDPVCTYETFGDAVKVGKVCDEWGYYWYEDPLVEEDIYNYVKLKHKLDIPIMSTEYAPGRLYGMVQWIQSYATDILRGDVAVTGGITPLIKIAHIAEGFGMKCEIHHGGNSLNNVANLHVMMAVHNCEFYEVFPATGANKYGLVNDIEVDNKGLVYAPTEPGLGYEIDWDLVERDKVQVVS